MQEVKHKQKSMQEVKHKQKSTLSIQKATAARSSSWSSVPPPSASIFMKTSRNCFSFPEFIRCCHSMTDTCTSACLGQRERFADQSASAMTLRDMEPCFRRQMGCARILDFNILGSSPIALTLIKVTTNLLHVFTFPPSPFITPSSFLRFGKICITSQNSE